MSQTGAEGTVAHRPPTPGGAPGARGAAAARWVLGAALLALVAALSLQQIRSFDYWWHLETGERIAAEGAVPKVDGYSYSVPGARWIDIHWLHQLGIYGLYRLGGHDAVVLGKLGMTIVLAGALVAAVGSGAGPGTTVLAVALGLLAASGRIMPRPELPTFVLLALELALLERWLRRRDAWIWAVVPLHLVWANLHGLFAVGLGVLGLAFGAELLEALRRRRRPDAAALRTLAAVGLASAAVCALNPNGLRGLVYPLEQALMIGPAEARARATQGSVELVSLLRGWSLVDRPTRAGFLGLLALGGAGLVANRRRARAFDGLVFVVFLGLAVAALRNVALFGIAAAPLAARNAGAALRGRLPAPAVQAGRGVLAVALLGLAGLMMHPVWGLWSRSFRVPGFGVMEVLHPVGAVEWIRRERPPGPIYHHMADGGYLIRNLPEYPVLVDGRLEVYGEELPRLSVTDVSGFRALDRRFHFGMALLGYSQFAYAELLGWLAERTEWRLAYVDDTSALFVRRRPGQLTPGRRVDAPDLFPPLPDDAFGTADLLRRLARMRFYAAVGRAEETRRWSEDVQRRYGPFLASPGDRSGRPARPAPAPVRKAPGRPRIVDRP